MEGKLFRRSLTDSLKNSGEDERMHGKSYPNYSKLINKSLGLPQKVDRDSLSSKMLEKIAYRKNLVSALLNEGKQYYEIKDIINSLSIA